MSTISKTTLLSQKGHKFTGNDFVSITAYIFILLFVYTATDKFFTMHNFIRFMNSLAILKIAGTFLAWAVPATELIVTVLLIIPTYRFIGLISSAILMTGFTTYLIYLKLTQPRLPCSCGGIIDKLSWTQHIWLNLALIILAIIASIMAIRMKRNYNANNPL